MKISFQKFYSKNFRKVFSEEFPEFVFWKLLLQNMKWSF